MLRLHSTCHDYESNDKKSEAQCFTTAVKTTTTSTTTTNNNDNNNNKHTK